MLQQYWRGLPAWFRTALLPGTVGSFRCMRLAARALGGEHGDGQGVDATLFMAGRDLLLAAWEDDPLNGDFAHQLLSLDSQMPWLSMSAKATLLRLAACFNRPENQRYYQRLAQQADYGRIRSYLDGERVKDPANAYWLQQVMAAGELSGDLPWVLEHVRDHWPESLAECAQLRMGVLTHVLTAMGRYDEALHLFARAAQEGVTAVGQCAAAAVRAETEAHHAAGAAARCLAGMEAADSLLSMVPGGPLLLADRLAHCLWQAGERGQAHALWRRILMLRPWSVNTIMRLYDSVQANDSPQDGAQLGRVAALLYSWNKADDLNSALECLAPSASGLWRIVALNNGSTDSTADVITAWADRLGGRMQAIHLPVNVGAPAARNWLKNLPEMAQADFIAYLDDDAMLPPDWLGHMARAVHVCPQASVWGGKILDQHAPHVVQSADLHLTMKSGTEEEVEAAFSLAHALAVPFNVTDIHAQVSDTGRFDYIRPCVSVTGCCHLFRAADLAAGGDFSLFYSPSQYDDLEHDLRMAAQGRHCAYTGFLAVRHLKRTGKAVGMSPAQYGNGAGNKFKLHAAYGRDRIEAIMRAESALLEQDLLAKASVLDSLPPA